MSSFPISAEVRRLLSTTGTRSFLEEAVHVPALRAWVLDIARVDVQEASAGTLVSRAEYWMTAARTTWQESAAFLADVVWQARRQGRGIAAELTAEQVSAPGLTTIAARTRLHLLGLALRYDFRRAALETLMNTQPRPISQLDVYSQALYAFALLGQSKPEGLKVMHHVLDAAEDDPKVLHALLHGLWLGDGLPDQAQHMFDILSRPYFRPRTDPVALYREARVLHQLHCYGEALATIDRAFEYLPTDDLSVHDDLVRERLLITTARDLHQITRAAIAG